MDDGEGTYAPQSPDLSGFHSYDESNAFNQPYSPPPQPSNHHQQLQQSLPPTHAHTFPQQQPFDPFAPDQSFPHLTYPDPQQQYPPMQKSQKSRTQRGDDEYTPDQPQPKRGRPRKQKAEEAVCRDPAPGTVEGVDVKTKFPVARIKRIMQADEDVGKVSQVTPTAVSKALELFIISLTLKSSAVARAKSSKRITAAHLKQAVVGDEQLDFLEQIVSKVPDAPTASKSEGKRKGAATEEEDESSDEAYMEARPKKKSMATRKRRTKEADD